MRAHDEACSSCTSAAYSILDGWESCKCDVPEVADAARGGLGIAAAEADAHVIVPVPSLPTVVAADSSQIISSSNTSFHLYLPPFFYTVIFCFFLHRSP